MRLNGELPEAFELRVLSHHNNPEQELGDFETAPDHAGRFCNDFAVKGTDLKLRQDGDDPRDFVRQFDQGAGGVYVMHAL